MPAAETLTVLLADDDALRRDGLAAVLESAQNIKVVARCQDGNEALEEIRNHHPRVAVVDINLPQVHGIELVRRVRADGSGTKIIILASTTDDETVREVVRAGADGYLLKNGPARHLVDAIRYVCDGGQYFSPQLGRDGRDRHLLEEPARTAPRPGVEEPPARPRAQDRPYDDRPAYDDPPAYDERPAYDDRPRREEAARQRTRRETTPLRDRLRAEAGGLDDRDYKIMSMMAESMKPILDRLEEIDNRVGQMEEGDADLPEDPRGWLSSQLADTFRGGKGDSRSGGGRNNRELESRLPQMIEQAVTERFQHMAGKLQEQIEETHVKTLETFVKNVQVKLVQRVSSLEQDMSRHTQAMQLLRDSSQRTEENLNRLITGVDKLAQELPKRIAAAGAAQNGQDDSDDEPVPVRPRARAKAPAAVADDDDEQSTSRVSAKKIVVWFLWGLVALAICAGIIRVAMTYASQLGSFNFFGKSSTTVAAAGSPGATPGPAPASVAKVTLPAGATTKVKLDAALQSVENKDYVTAEQILKEVVQTEPNNGDALKALASVLYRQDKIAESAAILDRIQK